MGEEKDNNIDSTNIFDEFSNDEELKAEVKKADSKTQKGGIYYLNSLAGFMKSINLLLILFFVVFFTYSYVQLNKDLNEKTFLTPFCKILLKNEVNGECSSVSSALNKVNSSIKKEETTYYNSILSMLGSVYELSNFAFSKEVLFLLDKADTRLKPLKILKEFDILKNKFEPINKSRLKCYKIEISADGILSLQCDAFSSQWDREILGSSGKKGDLVGGTSISYASSFINYIEKSSDKFVLLDKPRKFSATSVVGNVGFVKKTSFKLRLKLKDNNIGLLK